MTSIRDKKTYIPAFDISKQANNDRARRLGRSHVTGDWSLVFRFALDHHERYLIILVLVNSTSLCSLETVIQKVASRSFIAIYERLTYVGCITTFLDQI